MTRRYGDDRGETADEFGRKLLEGGGSDRAAYVGLSAAAGRKASCSGEKSLNVGL